MNYSIESVNSKIKNLIFQDKILGEFKYNNWLNTSDIVINIPTKGVFSIKKPSIWKNNFQVVQNDTIFFEIFFGWSSKVTIVDVCDNSKKYYFKQTSFFSSKYVLTNENETELIEYTSKFNWKTFKTTYYFTSNKNFENINIEVLLFIIFEIININTRMAVAVS
jgi:hypothetical protein